MCDAPTTVLNSVSLHAVILHPSVKTTGRRRHNRQINRTPG